MRKSIFLMLLVFVWVNGVAQSASMGSSYMTGNLMLVSVPSGARTIIDGEEVGVTPCLISELSVGSHTVSLFKDGYFPQICDVVVEEGKTVEKKLTLREKKSGGSLSISSYPSHAEVKIDGEKCGLTPLVKEGLYPGRYRVEITLDGCNPEVHDVVVMEGETVALNVAMGEKAQTGSLSVSSYPSGGTVRINGLAVGLTPFTRESLEVGTYSIEVTKDGYNDVVKDVVVTAGETSKMNVTLKEKQRTGSLYVTSTPTDAWVMVNGEIAGQTPCTKEGLPFGTYKVEVVKAGYLGEERNVAIYSESVKNMSFALQSNSGNTVQSSSYTTTQRNYSSSSYNSSNSNTSGTVSKNTKSSSLSYDKGKFVTFGLNASAGYDYDGYTFGLGGMMRIGRFDNRLNLLLGAKYQYVSPYLEHQFLVPVIINWNWIRFKKVSWYIGVGCDVCIASSEEGLISLGLDEDGALSIDELYPSTLGLSLGIAGKHFDWNVGVKVNEDFRILETGFTYYF